MRESLNQLFNDLKSNNRNTICFFRQNVRIEKTYAEFGADIEEALARLNYLKKTIDVKRVALIGPVSYDWIVCDMACIKGGFFSVAIPESLPQLEILEILKKTDVDIALIDFCLARSYDATCVNFYVLECLNKEIKKDFWLLNGHNENSNENRILKEYGIIFSSGTSTEIKYIKGVFSANEHNRKTIKGYIRNIAQYIQYKTSFWSKDDNKLIIFMPFSHSQQRSFFREGLFMKINIILSDPKNCIKHIITEKPNVMICVPQIYEILAKSIKVKVDKFNSAQRVFFKAFLILKINSLPNRNYLKRVFSFFLFKNIRKIYGGKADFFVTGSAPIATDTIKLFYNIGIKLLQAYGQSEIGNIAINTHANFKIGSVGKPIMKVKISDESEIMVKYEQSMHYSNKDILVIDEEGYIHTGDLGYLDKHGYLFISGRKDDIIVLKNGKKVFPQKLESMIKNADFVKDVCVFATDHNELHAVIECVGSPTDFKIKKAMENFNNCLPKHEKINAYYIAEKAFSPENGQLTGTLKKRREVIKRYYLKQDFIFLQ